MPIDIVKLLPLLDKKEVFNASKTFYQQKFNLLLFTAIATRPNITFAVSKLSPFNQRPRKIYHEKINQVFHYFLWMQNYWIYYKEETQDILSFVYASDILFADNLLDWKSF